MEHMSERSEGAILFSASSGAYGGNYWNGTLSARDVQGFQSFGVELGRITHGEAPANLRYPHTPPFAEAADALLEGSGFEGMTLKIGESPVNRPGDIIEERDAIYDALRRGGQGIQVILTIPEVARAILCGNTGLSSKQASDILCSGVVAMGFRAFGKTQSSEGPKGRIHTKIEQIGIEMTSYGTNPTQFSLER